MLTSIQEFITESARYSSCHLEIWSKRFHNCPECGKYFKKEGNLKVYVITVHYGIMEFAGTECTLTFFSKRNLIRHTEKNHPELSGQFNGSNQVYQE